MDHGTGHDAWTVDPTRPDGNRRMLGAIEGVPKAALRERVAIFGGTGSGKTFAAKGWVEQLLDQGRRVCIVDPTGVWWGLGRSTNGLMAGYRIVVFGGPHRDVDITPDNGQAVARTVAGERMTSVIDLSGMARLNRRHGDADAVACMRTRPGGEQADGVASPLSACQARTRQPTPSPATPQDHRRNPAARRRRRSTEGRMPEDPGLLDELARTDTADAIAACLFHGTAEPLTGDLRPGGFDGVFWTAATPAVAQTYIPASSAAALLQIDPWALDERVPPHRNHVAGALARTMCGSHDPEAEYDDRGMLRSWRIHEGWPTHRELLAHLRAAYGYEAEPGRPCWLLTRTGPDGGTTVLPADHRMAGTLIVLDRATAPTFTEPGEGDLIDPSHLRTEDFNTARTTGRAGIAIGDFCQSGAHGNVGHASYGLFAAALARVRWARIPARRFQWPPHAPVTARSTPEFDAALANRHGAPRHRAEDRRRRRPKESDDPDDATTSRRGGTAGSPDAPRR